jgi:hypothetical protein
MPWCIPHIEEASGRGCKAARQFFVLPQKAHRPQNQLTIIHVFNFVFFVPFCG